MPDTDGREWERERNFIWQEWVALTREMLMTDEYNYEEDDNWLMAA